MKKRKKIDWNRIPIVYILGFSGSGKTKVLLTLLSRYKGKVHIIPRFTTRAPRLGETSLEYNFVSDEVFKSMLKVGCFMKRTVRDTGTAKFAVLQMKLWPEPPKGTELIVCSFGSKALLLQDKIPGKVVFISSGDTCAMAERLIARCKAHKINPRANLNRIFRYKTRKIWRFCDFEVWNDRTPRESADAIASIGGIKPKGTFPAWMVIKTEKEKVQKL